jgi:16S rRNA (guanine(966)-N(2))-methyltransferase RsmD
LRIISGKYRSRKVYTSGTDIHHTAGSKLSGFRPTTDRAKESLFNVLNNLIDFDSITCADLYAGSGALGFEAISRGAAKCDFVESSGNQSAMILKTANELKCGDNVNIIKSDVMKFLIENEGVFYDLIFADPPYSYENYIDLTSLVLNLKFSIFVLEHGPEGGLMYSVNDYDVIDKKIGFTNFKIFLSKE